MMSQSSHGVRATFQFLGPRIIKHKDAKAVSGFQSRLFYAYGPLYHEEIKAEEVPGEANPEAAANLRFRQRITKVAWMYFVDQTRRDPDLMDKIKHIQMVRPEQIMSESSLDLERQDPYEWEGNPNGTSGDHDHQNAATEQIEREDDDEKMIKGYYTCKIGDVLEEAKSVVYDKDGTSIDEMPESSFKYMMIKHGCLFLLQMFVFLGLGVDKLKELSELSGPHLDKLFGSDDEDIEERKIMFAKCAVFPGNQIPLAVLNKLIDTSFFKNVVLKEDWTKPSSSSSSSLDLVLKSVLYDLILDPVLKNSGSSSSSTFSEAQTQLNSTQAAGQIIDILHGLHSRLVGTTTTTMARGDIRLQHGNADHSRRNNLEPQSDNQRNRLSSAKEMYSKGMHFKGVSGMAIREINIKGSVFTKKVLHLPVFTFNEMTKHLYTCLKDYENHQGPSWEKVVNDYLQFLRDIIQDDQDVVLLEQKGVIEMDSNEVEIIDKVVEYLREVACDTPLTCTTHHLRTLKLAISHHHLKPWYYKYFTGALFSITLSILSLTFGILGYFLARSKKT